MECKIATQCLQLHGGAGYLYDTPIAKAFVDSRVQTIYGKKTIINFSLPLDGINHFPPLFGLSLVFFS